MSHRAFRTTAALLLFVSLLIPSCGTPIPRPLGGVARHQQLGLLRVPGGLVNAAGGNLVVQRIDLSIDTRVGTRELGATYNGADRRWRWSFEATLVDGVFTDPSGAVHDTSGLAEGEAIPGTHWVKRGASEVQTLGGLVHAFGVSGRLVAVYWASDPYPRLEYVGALVGDEVRTVRVEQCVAPGDCALVFDLAYDASGRLVEAADRAGRRADFGWDAAGGLAWARSALDVAEGWPGQRYEYDGEGRLVARTTSEGERVEFDLAGDRVVAVRAIGPGSPTHRFDYAKLSNAVFETRYVGAAGEETTLRWSAQRTVQRITWPRLGESVHFAWAGRNLTAVTDAAGLVTTLERPSSDVLTMTAPSGNTTTVEHAPGGVNRSAPFERAVARVTDGLGERLAVEYDTAGRPVRLTRGSGESWTFGYDGLGQLASVADPTGREAMFGDYGEDGHARVVEVDGQVVDEREYDAVGNLVRGIERDDAYASSSPGIVERAFDANRGLASIAVWGRTASGSKAVEHVQIERRSDGRILEIRRPGGGDDRFDYDALGRVVARREFVDGDWVVTDFEYDASDRRVAESRANGMRQELDLDDLGRTQEIRNLRDGALESWARFTYEAGRLASIVDSVAGEETYVHDAAGRVAEVRFAGGEGLELVRDVRGRVGEALLRLPLGEPLTTLSFVYDGDDRDVEVQKDGFRLLARTFEDGRLSQVDYGNGLQRQYTHESDGEEGTWVEMVTLDPTGAVLEETTAQTHFFGRTASSWRQNTSLEIAGVGPIETSEYFFLDALGTGPTGEHFEVGAVLSAINGADFDSLGNALKSDVATMTYNDEHNRLLRLDDLATGATLREYGYDAAGFVTSIDGAPVTWTAHGRVRTVGVDVALEWDARGRPISQTVLGETTYRMFGGLVEAEAPGLPTSLDLTEVKVDLVGDEHLYRHLGARSNVKFVTNAQGDVVAGYRYDAFGRTQVFGSDADGVRFAQGAEVEGLVVLGARVYDPLAQRFLSPDPVHHLINQYAYPANPVWFWDPDGRRLGWISIGLGAVSMVAAVAAMVVAPAVAVHLAAISLTVGALSLAVAVTQQLIDDGVLQSPAQRKELTLSCACGGGGGGGSGAGQGAGDSVGVAGPGNGPLIVVEGFAFKNGRFRGKVGGPDSAFAAHSSAAPGHGPVGCLGQDTSSPVGPGCASAVPLPLLWLFFRSRMRRRSA